MIQILLSSLTGGAKRWHMSLGCFLAGALITLGFAPFDIWPVGFISIPILLTALQSAATLRTAMSRAFFFGYGYSMAGTYWVGNALLVDAEKFGWMWPISLLGLSAVMALWFAVMGALVYWTRGKSLGVNVVRLAAVWMLVEHARTWGIISFPWNFLGSMALSVPSVAQFISVVGTYGMSFLLVLLFALPVLWIGQGRLWLTSQPVAPESVPVYDFISGWNFFTWVPPYTGIKKHKAIATAACFSIASIVLYGYSRIPAVAAMTDQSVRVVQGNIAQSLKWSQAGELESERVYSGLTQSPSALSAVPTVVIWPETAVPIPYHSDSIWPQQVGQLLPKSGTLITGALRVDMAPDSGERRIWNSLLVIDHSGALLATYDKHQLVPFGEFVPLRDVLPLSKITPGDTDFSRGEGPKTLAVEGVSPFRPLICYEVIFPKLSAATPRPQWLVNVTNDGWYGDSTGPHQHLAASQLRAIEQGLPLVRAANTGISAVIDPYGRILQSLPLGTRGVIDQMLPAALPPTPYARFGDWLAWGLALFAWIATILQRKRIIIK